jgi:choline dehydrogenase
VTDDRFDALGLGGGAAGCVIAARHTEDADRRVCLVEAGPDYGPLAVGDWPADLLDPNEAGTATGEYLLRLSASALQPRSVGRVTLHWADPAVPPLSDDGGADLDTLAEGIRQARRIAQAPSLQSLGVREQAAGPSTADDIHEHVRATLGCYCHPVGTCALGPAGDAAAVAGGDGAVHGLAGVHIADDSIMPAIPRAQTHLTVLAVADRLADRLRGRAGEAPSEAR